MLLILICIGLMHYNEVFMDKIAKLLYELVNEAGEVFLTAGNKQIKFSIDTLSGDDNKLQINKDTTDTNYTIVTGLWDLGRGELKEFERSYEHYKEKFAELLKSPANMLIYVSKKDEEFVWKYREKHNTEVKIMELEEFKTWFEFYDIVQEIRKTPAWYKQVDWLHNSPQASLEYYNPIIMSKMFLLNNATIFNPFNSKYFYWIDAGITNTVHAGYFSEDKVLDNLPIFSDLVDKFIFLTYQYEHGTEIHGFDRTALTRYSKTRKVKYVCRGGFFGGKKDQVNKINGLYHSMLSNTLADGYMGTEESVFTILSHLYADDVYNFSINFDGLIWPFFEKLKYREKFVDELTNSQLKHNTSLYVLGFNSPKQFKVLCESIINADYKMFDSTNKFLINNSTDESLFEEYDELCEEYGFVEIHQKNLGICGGRQFIAEHFNTTNADFYLFFEDDMSLNSQEDRGKCKFGFEKYISQIYETILTIMKKEELDFLKLSFSEFYGDNSTQWAWYNVPQYVRSEYWPEYDKLPDSGLDENAPKTLIKEIKVENQIPYVIGDIYYSNWPQIVSRIGNKKMFLDTKWEHPYEQTWMSHIFQLTKHDQIRCAVLLASPITHDRFQHYDKSLRKES